MPAVGDSAGYLPVALNDSTDNGITSQTNGAQRALDVGVNVAGVQIDPRQQGTPNTLANAWPIEITDGTNGPVSVKPASTPAAAGDPSLVIAISPNSPLPAGSNNIGSVNQGTSPWVTNVSQFGGSNVVTGIGASGSGIPRVSLSNDSKILIWDGTNIAAVKAASTPAAATDPSLVVALSPNSPLPSGSNALGSVLANLQVLSAPVTILNPVPVYITTASGGTPVQDYHTSANLAVNASVTFTYTVGAGHSLSLERIWASAPGRIKVVVQNGATNLFTGFNSSATPNVDITVTAPPTIAAAGTVNVTITNEDVTGQAFNVYATIEGNLVS